MRKLLLLMLPFLLLSVPVYAEDDSKKGDDEDKSAEHEDRNADDEDKSADNEDKNTDNDNKSAEHEDKNADDDNKKEDKKGKLQERLEEYQDKLNDYKQEKEQLEQDINHEKKRKELVELTQEKNEKDTYIRSYEIVIKDMQGKPKDDKSKKIKSQKQKPKKLAKNINLVDEYKNNKVDHSVVDVGKKLIGKSDYVFGAGRNEYDVQRQSFDCSSFVHWSYDQVDIKLGNRSSVTTDTLKYAGKQVSKSDIKVGDLIFFDTYKKDGHVGIYAGDNKFIGDQESTGVSMADLDNPYWSQHFNGRVVRIK